MYYLEDDHPAFEYTLYIQVSNATPYIGIWKGDNLKDVYRKIGEIEHKHNKYRQPFYIDNDFYKNEYSNVQNGVYYKFMCRKINDWKELKTKEKVRKLKLAE